MIISKINSNQNFKGIKISKNMPKMIIDAIKENPVIKKAGKNYSLCFSYNKNQKNNTYYAVMSMTSPKTDSFIGLMTTPPHSIKSESQYLGTKTNAIMDKLEKIEDTYDYFEKILGTPRTFKQKLTAFLEALEITFMPKERTVAQEVKLHKILKKYETLNMP